MSACNCGVGRRQCGTDDAALDFPNSRGLRKFAEGFLCVSQMTAAASPRARRDTTSSRTRSASSSAPSRTRATTSSTSSEFFLLHTLLLATVLILDHAPTCSTSLVDGGEWRSRIECVAAMEERDRERES
eukprot:76648-Rhodomonas_salina.1